MCEQYNGYSNYQTWCVALWLDNDEGTCDLIYDIANSEKTDYNKVQELKGWFEEYQADMQCEDNLYGMLNDLLQHAIGAIDWYEIVESHKED